MNSICDLHTHSIFSDGTYSPSEIINEAVRIGLSAVALCDHNTVDGLPEFLSAASGKPIEAIAGAEFSVDYEGTELHLLGLFIPAEYFEHVSRLMLDVNNRKEESNLALIDSLNRSGFSLNYATIKARTPNGKVNRAHIAAELTNLGYTASVEEAFDTLLSPAAGHYTEPKRLTVWEALDFVSSINAVPVIAHPFLNLTEARLNEFLPLAKKAGLKGMECYYSKYDAATTAKSLQIANSFGLKVSGGSDFHGSNKPGIFLGHGKNNLSIPYECVLALKP